MVALQDGSPHHAITVRFSTHELSSTSSSESVLEKNNSGDKDNTRRSGTRAGAKFKHQVNRQGQMEWAGDASWTFCIEVGGGVSSSLACLT